MGDEDKGVALRVTVKLLTTLSCLVSGRTVPWGRLLSALVLNVSINKQTNKT